MNVPRRLPGLLLAVVAVVLTAVIVERVSAGADPAPQDTAPIVLSPSPTPSSTPSTSPGQKPTPSATAPTTPGSDDEQIAPRLRDDDDDDGPDDDDDDHRGHDDEHDDD